MAFLEVALQSRRWIRLVSTEVAVSGLVPQRSLTQASSSWRLSFLKTPLSCFFHTCFKANVYFPNLSLHCLFFNIWKIQSTARKIIGILCFQWSCPKSQGCSADSMSAQLQSGHLNSAVASHNTDCLFLKIIIPTVNNHNLGFYFWYCHKAFEFY